MPVQLCLSSFSSEASSETWKPFLLASPCSSCSPFPSFEGRDYHSVGSGFMERWHQQKNGVSSWKTTRRNWREFHIQGNVCPGWALVWAGNEIPALFQSFFVAGELLVPCEHLVKVENWGFLPDVKAGATSTEQEPLLDSQEAPNKTTTLKKGKSGSSLMWGPSWHCFGSSLVILHRPSGIYSTNSAILLLFLLLSLHQGVQIHSPINFPIRFHQFYFCHPSKQSVKSLELLTTLKFIIRNILIAVSHGEEDNLSLLKINKSKWKEFIHN